MAGTWTYTGDVAGIDTYLASVDAGKFKVTAFPTLGASNTGWWQDFAFAVAKQFARLQKQNGQGTTLQITANNGGGDTAGVGTLTMTFVVA
jgi:hypothetical protein